MKKYSKLLLGVVFGVLATDAGADPSNCTTCGLSHLEQIKSDRAKYDLENDKSQEDLERKQIKADRAKYDRDNDEQERSHLEQIKAGRVDDRENEKIIDRFRDEFKDGVPSRGN
jgi:hypothetical protein